MKLKQLIITSIITMMFSCAVFAEEVVLPFRFQEFKINQELIHPIYQVPVTLRQITVIGETILCYLDFDEHAQQTYISQLPISLDVIIDDAHISLNPASTKIHTDDRSAIKGITATFKLKQLDTIAHMQLQLGEFMAFLVPAENLPEKIVSN